MSRLDAEAQQQINAALRQMLADSMSEGSGGFIGVWDLPDRYQVAHIGDLAVTYAEQRSAGLGVMAALNTVAAEIRADERSQPDSHLVGLGLIGHAYMGPNGVVASLLALVEGWSHEILWLHAQAQPTWKIRPVADADDEDCATYLNALSNLIDALTGPACGGAK
jgi:hypothetical protein